MATLLPCTGRLVIYAVPVDASAHSHLVHGSLACRESALQTLSRLIQPFLQGSLVCSAYRSWNVRCLCAVQPKPTLICIVWYDIVNHY